MIARSHEAFTLIELLVVITIIAVLAALILPVYSSVQNSASSAASVSNFRQIGAAIQSYANDNNTMLPGPLWGTQGGSYVNGQVVSYSAQPPVYAGGSLVVFLGPYLGNPATGQKAYTGCFMYPAFVPYARKNPSAPIYLMSDLTATGTSTAAPTNTQPFGYPTGAHQPARMSEISLLCPSFPTSWAICELDQSIQGLTPNGTWYTEIPVKPLHHAGRNALFYDWHVGRIKDDGTAQ